MSARMRRSSPKKDRIFGKMAASQSDRLDWENMIKPSVGTSGDREGDQRGSSGRSVSGSTRPPKPVILSHPRRIGQMSNPETEPESESQSGSEVSYRSNSGQTFRSSSFSATTSSARKPLGVLYTNTTASNSNRNNIANNNSSNTKLPINVSKNVGKVVTTLDTLTEENDDVDQFDSQDNDGQYQELVEKKDARENREENREENRKEDREEDRENRENSRLRQPNKQTGKKSPLDAASSRISGLLPAVQPKHLTAKESNVYDRDADNNLFGQKTKRSFKWDESSNEFDDRSSIMLSPPPPPRLSKNIKDPKDSRVASSKAAGDSPASTSTGTVSALSDNEFNQNQDDQPSGWEVDPGESTFLPVNQTLAAYNDQKITDKTRYYEADAGGQQLYDENNEDRQSASKQRHPQLKSSVAPIKSQSKIIRRKSSSSSSYTPAKQASFSSNSKKAVAAFEKSFTKTSTKKKRKLKDTDDDGDSSASTSSSKLLPEKKISKLASDIGMDVEDLDEIQFIGSTTSTRTGRADAKATMAFVPLSFLKQMKVPVDTKQRDAKLAKIKTKSPGNLGEKTSKVSSPPALRDKDIQQGGGEYGDDGENRDAIEGVREGEEEAMDTSSNKADEKDVESNAGKDTYRSRFKHPAPSPDKNDPHKKLISVRGLIERLNESNSFLTDTNWPHSRRY